MKVQDPRDQSWWDEVHTYIRIIKPSDDEYANQVNAAQASPYLALGIPHDGHDSKAGDICIYFDEMGDPPIIGFSLNSLVVREIDSRLCGD